MNISSLRDEISAIDEKLIPLLERRLKAARAVGAYKRKNALPLRDYERESVVLSHAAEFAKNAQDIPYLEKLLSDIMAVSRQAQSDCRNIYLTGMPYSGKTSMAMEISAQLERPYIDSDAEIEAKHHMSVREYFIAYGEESFRETEHETLSDIAENGGLIVATGGGVYTKRGNAELIHNSGVCVYLDKSLDELIAAYERARDYTRPLISSVDDLSRIYFERMVDYRQNADFIIDPTTDGALESVCEFIQMTLS